MPEHTPSPTPSRSVYGFAMFLSFKLFFIIYIVWAYIPESWFELVGITYLPNRYWAVTVPVFLLTVLTIFAFVIYPSLGLLMTPGPDELNTIFDSKSKHKETSENIKMHEAPFCSCRSPSLCKKNQFLKDQRLFLNKRIPVLSDLNITDVSEHLYVK